MLSSLFFKFYREGLKWSGWTGFQCWTTNISHQPTAEPPRPALCTLPLAWHTPGESLHTDKENKVRDSGCGSSRWKNSIFFFYNHFWKHDITSLTRRHRTLTQHGVGAGTDSEATVFRFQELKGWNFLPSRLRRTSWAPSPWLPSSVRAVRCDDGGGLSSARKGLLHPTQEN